MLPDDQAKIAHASLADLTKQLVTLSTAILTLEVTFAKAFAKEEISQARVMTISWICFVISVAFGIWVLMALTGTQANAENLTSQSIYNKNIRTPAKFQVLSFIIGLIFTIVVGTTASLPENSFSKASATNLIREELLAKHTSNKGINVPASSSDIGQKIAGCQ